MTDKSHSYIIINGEKDNVMDLSIIGFRLVSLRKSKGISQLKLAEITKLDRTYLSRVEAGKQNMTITTLITICNGLGVTLAEFFDF